MARDAFRDIAPLLDAACGSVLDNASRTSARRLHDGSGAPAAGVTEADFPRLRALSARWSPRRSRHRRSGPRRRAANRSRPQGAGAPGRPQAPADADLRAEDLGRLVGMSRSNLYRLFEDTGGVARYIQRERLLEARAVLSDLATTQSISAIAEDFCFADASSFSRAFKREFGYSPSEVRSAALAGLAVVCRPMKPSAIGGERISAASCAGCSISEAGAPGRQDWDTRYRCGIQAHLKRGHYCKLRSV